MNRSGVKTVKAKWRGWNLIQSAARFQRPGWEVQWGPEEVSRTKTVAIEDTQAVGRVDEHPAYAGEILWNVFAGCIGHMSFVPLGLMAVSLCHRERSGS